MSEESPNNFSGGKPHGETPQGKDLVLPEAPAAELSKENNLPPSKVCVDAGEKGGTFGCLGWAGAGRSAPAYFRASDIAEALTRAGQAVSKKTIQRRAESEQWPSRANGNRFEYQPPDDIAALVSTLNPQLSTVFAAAPSVTFTDLTHDADQRKKVMLREEVVQHYDKHIRAGMKIELALASAAVFGNRRSFEEAIENFGCSPRSVRRWAELYKAHGLNGLVEQKKGKVGRTPVSASVPAEIITRIKAKGIEHGSGGRTNVARGFRMVLADANAPHSLRELGADTYVSKSHVPKSIRQLATAAPLTARMAQVGTRHARLSSRWTPGNYDDVKAGDVWCPDDMTSNVVSWVEWPNSNGFRLAQYQLLPLIDVGSLRWLNFRLVARESGLFTTDDIWGMFGDCFDKFKLPRQGMVLEGGNFQGKKIIGHRTGLDQEERIGGLTSLGLEVWRARTPGAKIIETAFNQLQYAMDAVPGFIGREQRYDKVEKVAKLQDRCNRGEIHPKDAGFLHISKLADHIEATMASLNNERNDGVILRGRTPLEKWCEEEGGRIEIPPQARWMYRSAFSLVRVTRNGIRVTQNSGKNLMAYYYDADWLVSKEGQRVRVYWNGDNPETDAIVLDDRSQFLGVAKYVTPLARFSATEEQLKAESARKRAALNYSRSELRSVQPELQRTQRVTVPTDASANRIGNEIAQATERTEERQRVKAQGRREVAKVEVTDTDREGALQSATEPAPEPPRMSAEEISSLFTDP